MKANIQGFTLAELTIVLSIISIMSLIAMPSILKAIPDYRLKKAARALYGDLQMAKSTAVLTKEIIKVVFNSEKGSYHIESLGFGNNLNKEAHSPGIIKKSVSLANFGSGVKFGRGSVTKSVGGADIPDDFISYRGSNSVSFNINGLTKSLGYVYLTNENNSLCYTVGTPTCAGIIVILKATGTASKWVVD